jgi:hypothetical protein
VNRDLRRVVACGAADHLERAARILHQAPTVDGIMLAGNRTAEIITVLAKAAARPRTQPAQASRGPTATTPADDIRLTVPPSDPHHPTSTTDPDHPALPLMRRPSTAAQPPSGPADHRDDRAS